MPPAIPCCVWPGGRARFEGVGVNASFRPVRILPAGMVPLGAVGVG